MLRAAMTCLSLTCVWPAAAGAAEAATVGKRVGQIFPDFVLPAIDDRRPVALSDFRGKKVLLIEFASW